MEWDSGYSSLEQVDFHMNFLHGRPLPSFTGDELHQDHRRKRPSPSFSITSFCSREWIHLSRSTFLYFLHVLIASRLCHATSSPRCRSSTVHGAHPGYCPPSSCAPPLPPPLALLLLRRLPLPTTVNLTDHQPSAIPLLPQSDIFPLTAFNIWQHSFPCPR